jgi:transforming growth factor-beta-induced protein
MRLKTLAVASAFLFGCADDNDTKTPPAEPLTIAATVAADARFATLATALDAAELTETLGGAGPFTVFAPTEEAFAALPEGTLEALLADKEALADVLTYHVINDEVTAAEVVELTEATALNGDAIEIAVVDGGVVLNGSAKVTITDVAAANGIIHIIDAVLLPPEDDTEEPAGPGNLAAVLQADGRFGTLLTAVGEAELGAALSGDDKLTVLAPTDAAFAALPEGALAALLADKAKLADVLTYHVVAGDVRAETVVTLKRATALNGVDFSIAATEAGVTLNGTVKVTETDIVAGNGVIHVLDAVLLPPGNIVEIAAASADFETLVTAVTAAGLADDLAGAGPFTVFAPTDAAFEALPEGALEALLADEAALGRTLGAHVVNGKVYADGVVAASPLATLATEFGLDVTVVEGKVFVEGAEVIMTDIIARNGVIHVISSVIVP